ncbi:WD40 repeat-like protein [Paxillus ammoniavirescens]|nr:WD40 repeat-like protein [Paxillus ammoniavirescens]
MGHKSLPTSRQNLTGGKRIVTCSLDKMVRLWDVEKGEQEGTSMVHPGKVYDLAVTRDGKRILSSGDDKRIRVWDVETQKLIEEWAGCDTGELGCIALSPDDQLAASGHCGHLRPGDGKIVIRKMKESGAIKHSIDAGGVAISLCFSPNGKKLACGGGIGIEHVIQVYDVESGKLILGPIKGHRGDVKCVLWSLGGSKLFSASYDRTIRCWNTETGDSIGKPWKSHTDHVTCLSLSPDGTKLASVSNDKTVRFWDARSGEPIDHPLQHEYGLWAVTFSPSGEFVTCGGLNEKVSLWRVPWWDADSQKLARNPLLDFPALPLHKHQHQGEFDSLDLPAGRRLIASSSRPPAQATDATTASISTRVQRLPAAVWNLTDNDIRSGFAPDLTGSVVQEGEAPFTSGSFGDIYRGKLHLNGSSVDVAVKAIKTYEAASAGDDADQNKKFRRELKTWVNLDHVNILPLFGTTMNFGRFPAMVCPWLENGSLTSYLEHQHGTLKPVERLVVIGDAAAGLQYLHSQSIVHGDLSGSNVLIDGNGRAYISDFGLSIVLTKLGGSTYATSSHAGGTLRWIAPELLDLQVLDDEGNPLHVVPKSLSDVYSFGRIMLQVLTGKIPYHYYISEGKVMSAILQGIIPMRPNPPLVTDRQWKFMQRCWMPIDVGEPRPSADEIVEFAREELVAIEKASW